MADANKTRSAFDVILELRARRAQRKRGRGRPRHEATDELKQAVQSFAVGGGRHEDIAMLMGIDLTTLYKYYRSELDLGKSASSLMCTGQLHKAIAAGEAWAICFYAKTQLGFRESRRNEEPLPMFTPPTEPNGGGNGGSGSDGAQLLLTDESSNDPVLDYMLIMSGDKELAVPKDEGNATPV
jgi:hypothetical protein